MRSSHLMVPVILLLASIGLFFGFINGRFKEKQELEKKVIVYKDALKNVDEVQTRLNSLMKKRGTIENNLPQLENLLPDSVDTVRMVMDLNGIASRHGILIKSIKIIEPASAKEKATAQTATQKPVADTAYDKIGFTFNLVTSYEKFGGFLKDLEKSLRIFDINSISLKATEEGSQVYDFTLSGDTYWLK